MVKQPPHVVRDTNLHNLQLAHQRHAALADVAMSSLLGEMAGLPHDRKMAIVRAAIAYAEADSKRVIALARCQAAKKARAGE